MLQDPLGSYHSVRARQSEFESRAAVERELQTNTSLHRRLASTFHALKWRPGGQPVASSEPVAPASSNVSTMA